MNRPELLSVLAVVQWFWAVLYGFVGALLLLGSVREIRAGDDWADRFIFFGSVCAVLMLVSLMAGYGIWKLKLWGQLLALISIGLWVAMLGYGWYDEGEWEHEVLPGLAVFVVVLILHLLPATWRAFRPKVQNPPSTIYTS